MTIKRSDNIKVAMQKVAMRFKTKLPVDFDLLSKYKHLGGENLNFLSHPGGRMLERMSGGRGNLTGKHTDSFLKQLAKEIKDLPVGGKADVAGFYPGRVTPDELARLAKDPKKLSAKPLSRELALFPLEKSTRPIQKGQRLFQIVGRYLEPIELELVEELSNSERGNGGFGKRFTGNGGDGGFGIVMSSKIYSREQFS